MYKLIRMKLKPAEIKKIAIFRALQLGDLLCAIPAIRALRFAYPNAEITLLGLSWAESFIKRFHEYFDKCIHFPGYPGLPEQIVNINEYRNFTRIMQNENFDLLIQMQGNGTIVNPLMFQWGAKYVAGYYNAESYVDNKLFIEYPDYGPEPLRHIMLMEHLGISSQGNHLEYPLYDSDIEDLKELLLPVVPKKYVIVHPGSRGAWRQWPTQYFAALADYCIEQGLTVIITGTAGEMDITREVMKDMRYHAIDLTGKTSMGAIGALIKDALILISNCTGVSHIASALKTSSIVISMDGEPERWGPTDRRIHKVIDWTKKAQLNLVFDNLTELIQSLSVVNNSWISKEKGERSLFTI